MARRTLTLLGGNPVELRVSTTTLIEALDALIEGARMATRFAVEGESVRQGPRPAWLDAACEFHVRSLSAGSAIITLEAHTLGEVDQTRFGIGTQPAFFEETDERFGEQTALDLFGHLLSTVLKGERDEIVADHALLKGCARFVRATGRHYEGIRLDGLHGHAAPLVVSPSDAPRIEHLRDELPPPQGARVSGTLDTVSASRADIVLTLEDGSRVPGRMEDHDIDSLRSLIGKEVVVSGVAHYRPTGKLLRMDIEALDRARLEDRIFRKTPVARRKKIASQPPAPQEDSGVSAFFGTWPGDETDAELLESLRKIG